MRKIFKAILAFFSYIGKSVDFINGVLKNIINEFSIKKARIVVLITQIIDIN